MARDFELLLYGATGFTGQQAAAYLSKALDGTDHSWAIGGRSGDRLEAIAERLEGKKPAVVVADANDRDAVYAMVARTRVIVSTAGPYARYGDHVVVACVDHETHYCDTTGESPWVRQVIDRLHDRAVERGVRLVPFCGFDSIP